MSNLVKRALTAGIAGTAAIAAIVLSPLGFWLFCLIVSVVGMWEFFIVTGVGRFRYMLPALASAIFLWLVQLPELLGNREVLAEDKTAAIILLGFPILALITLFDKDIKNPLETLGLLVLGFVYTIVPFLLFLLIAIPKGPELYHFHVPLGILGLTWALDVFAYFFGKYLGKHPLFQRISPKKTWEGSLGGALICMLSGLLLQLFLPEPGLNWIVIAAIISVFSQLGDLVESMFKRKLSLKDSGSLLPGHGGMLDRFDGMLISLPFLYFYIELI